MKSRRAFFKHLAAAAAAAVLPKSVWAKLSNPAVAISPNEYLGPPLCQWGDGKPYHFLGFNEFPELTGLVAPVPFHEGANPNHPSATPADQKEAAREMAEAIDPAFWADEQETVWSHDDGSGCRGRHGRHAGPADMPVCEVNP